MSWFKGIKQVKSIDQDRSGRKQYAFTFGDMNRQGLEEHLRAIGEQHSQDPIIAAQDILALLLMRQNRDLIARHAELQDAAFGNAGEEGERYGLVHSLLAKASKDHATNPHIAPAYKKLKATLDQLIHEIAPPQKTSKTARRPRQHYPSLGEASVQPAKAASYPRLY